MVDMLNASPLAAEYEALVAESRSPGGGAINWRNLETRLSTTAGWTDEAAVQLVHLARSYGAFLLRNALALAVAAEVEDGELGF